MISRIVNSIRRFVAAIAVVSNVAGAFVLLGLVVITNSDVIARGLFNSPIMGVVELVIFSMILIVFLQLGDVVRTGRLTRSDGLLLSLKDSRPFIGGIIDRLIDGISCLFFALIAWTVWPEFLEAWESCHFFSLPEWGPPPSGNLWQDVQAGARRCDFFGTPGIFTTPWWPARLAIAFGVTLAAVIFFLKAVLGNPKSTSPEGSNVEGSSA